MLEEEKLIPPMHVLQCLQLMSAPNISEPHLIDARCIYLMDGRVFFAVILFETIDSFLLGASARLVSYSDEGDVKAEPFLPVPVIRILKTSVTAITKGLDKYQYYYFKYLEESGVKLLPEYLTGSIYQQVSDFIQKYELVKYGESKSEPTVDLKTEFEKKGIHGVSDYAFRASLYSGSIN